MYALMIAMNISSDGAVLSRASIADLQRQYRRDPVLGHLLYHQALWQRRNFSHYQYTLSRRCFAMPESEVRVRVESGVVTEVFCLPSTRGRSAPSDEGSSIDGLFDLIHQAILADPSAVKVEYHPMHGYPQSIVIEASASLGDSGYETA